VTHAFLLTPVPEPVVIDVEIISNSDCLNQKPVVIFGDTDVDVTSINVDTVVFGDEEADGRVRFLDLVHVVLEQLIGEYASVIRAELPRIEQD
jgi:hypothetical protein